MCVSLYRANGPFEEHLQESVTYRCHRWKVKSHSSWPKWHRHSIIHSKRVSDGDKACCGGTYSTTVSRWPGLNTEQLTPKTVGEVTPQRVFDASSLIGALQTPWVQAGIHTCTQTNTDGLSHGKHMAFFQLNGLISPISCPSDLTFPEVPDPGRNTLKAQRDRP